MKAVTYGQARALVLIDELGSLKKVQSILGLRHTTPLNNVMRRLAEALETGPMISIKGDSVVLTAEGQRFLPLANALKDAHDAIKRPPDMLRVTAYPSHAGAFASAIASFALKHEPLRIEFHGVADDSRRDQGARMLDLVSEGVTDVVIAPSGRGRGSLRELPLFEWKLRVVLHKQDDLRDREVVHMSDLANHKFLVSPYGHMSREIFDGISARSGVVPPLAMELIDQSVLARVARAFPGYAAVLPDDAFGRPDPRLGPLLAGDLRTARGGKYSVYVRKPGPKQRVPGSSAALALELAKSLAATGGTSATKRSS